MFSDRRQARRRRRGRRRGPEGVPEVLRAARPLHGRHGHALPSLGHLRRGHAPAPGRRASSSARASIRRRWCASPMPGRCSWAMPARPTAAGACMPLPARTITCDAAGRASARCAGSWRQSPDSPVRKYTRPGQDIDAVFDLRAIFQQGHRELAIESMPALLLPRKGRYGLRDYEKVFCAGPEERAGHLRSARHRPRAGRPGRGAPRPVRRPCAAAAGASGARGFLRRLHAAELMAN